MSKKASHQIDDHWAATLHVTNNTGLTLKYDSDRSWINGHTTHRHDDDPSTHWDPTPASIGPGETKTWAQITQYPEYPEDQYWWFEGEVIFNASDGGSDNLGRFRVYWAFPLKSENNYGFAVWQVPDGISVRGEVAGSRDPANRYWERYPDYSATLSGSLILPPPPPPPQTALVLNMTAEGEVSGKLKDGSQTQLFKIDTSTFMTLTEFNTPITNDPGTPLVDWGNVGVTWGEPGGKLTGTRFTGAMNQQFSFTPKGGGTFQISTNVLRGGMYAISMDGSGAVSSQPLSDDPDQRFYLDQQGGLYVIRRAGPVGVISG